MGNDERGSSFLEALDALDGPILFGGKGGVGKTTIASVAALRFARSRPTILFTTDPASNLGDLFDRPVENLTVESVDAETLYRRFLGEHLEAFLEIGDRGTYLDREELRRFFELSMPGVDELMAWMRIGELLEEHARSMLVVDTAPTGHTLRMLSSSAHFAQLATALDAMQEKHRSMVFQFARREVRDAIDQFIEEFDARARRRRELLTSRGTFIPVFLAEPWVIEQTKRLIDEVREEGIRVPFAILNRARGGEEAEVGVPVVRAERWCEPVDVYDWAAGVQREQPAASPVAPMTQGAVTPAPVLFLAGKGGVGKTTSAASIALQLANAHPEKRYVVISVDPAHSLRDVFAQEPPPPNLAVEIIDTKAKWRRFREKLGDEIERTIDGLAPRGVSIAHDGEAMKQLIRIAPPGADELFAIKRLAELVTDASLAGVIVDTAPTGHFLRLLDLPKSAGEWVRELMRILLRYRELVSSATLGEELISASRALKELDAALHDPGRTSVIVVTRPERMVVAETLRLRQEIEQRGLRVGGVIANYVTPANQDPCDRSMRAHELAALAELGAAVVVARQAKPVTALGDLAGLVPLPSVS